MNKPHVVSVGTVEFIMLLITITTRPADGQKDQLNKSNACLTIVALTCKVELDSGYFGHTSDYTRQIVGRRQTFPTLFSLKKNTFFSLETFCCSIGLVFFLMCPQCQAVGKWE